MAQSLPRGDSMEIEDCMAPATAGQTGTAAISAASSSTGVAQPSTAAASSTTAAAAAAASSSAAAAQPSSSGSLPAGWTVVEPTTAPAGATTASAAGSAAAAAAPGASTGVPASSGRPVISIAPLTTASAADNSANLAALQATFNELCTRVHARVAPSSAAPQPQLLTPQSLKALVDTLLAREDAVHAQLNAALMQQAQLQTRVSVSQRELLAFQPLLSELAHSRAQSSAHLRGTYLDPGVDALLSTAHTARMQALEQVRELQEKMRADGYVHDSVTGRKLLNRAKELKAENLKFAQDVRNRPEVLQAHHRMAELETQLSIERDQVRQLRHTLEETNRALLGMDAEILALHDANSQQRQAQAIAAQPAGYPTHG